MSITQLQRNLRGCTATMYRMIWVVEVCCPPLNTLSSYSCAGQNITDFKFLRLAIASSLCSPSLEGRMRAAMGATEECSANLIVDSVKYLICIHFYQWHQALCYFYNVTYHFTVYKSRSSSKVNNTEFSDMHLNRSPADMTSTQVLFEVWLQNHMEICGNKDVGPGLCI